MSSTERKIYKGNTTTTTATAALVTSTTTELSSSSFFLPCPSAMVSPYRPEHTSEFGANCRRGHVQTWRRTDREGLIPLIQHAFTIQPTNHPPTTQMTSSSSSSQFHHHHHKYGRPRSDLKPSDHPTPGPLRRMSSPLLPTNLVQSHQRYPPMLACSDGSQYAARLLLSSTTNNNNINGTTLSPNEEDILRGVTVGRGCITLRPKRPRAVDDISDGSVL